MGLDRDVDEEEMSLHRDEEKYFHEGVVLRCRRNTSVKKDGYAMYLAGWILKAL